MTDDLVVSLVGKDVKDVVKEGEIRWIYLLFEWFERRDASRKLWIIFCYIEIVPHHWWFIWISRLTVFRWYFISFICTKVFWIIRVVIYIFQVLRSVILTINAFYIGHFEKIWEYSLTIFSKGLLNLSITLCLPENIGYPSQDSVYLSKYFSITFNKKT